VLLPMRLVLGKEWRTRYELVPMPSVLDELLPREQMLGHKLPKKLDMR
jgi:hypothetical protein